MTDTTQTNSDAESTTTTSQHGEGKREVVITRTIDAPRELVFEAWTDPKHMAQWWGPRYFTNPVCELDVRPGGAILVHMLGPDGTVYPMKGIFREIVKPERLVFTSGAFEDEDGNPRLESLTTVTFTEFDGKTKLTVHAVVTRAEPGVEGALAGMEEGWSQSLDKLTEYVEIDMNKVTSKDGTPIAFDRLGEGPAVILVSGALGVRSHPIMARLAEQLAPHFTVLNYDRRGKGDSGDTPTHTTYAVEREIDDIEALIDEAGGPDGWAYLYGLSSGAALALEAANKLGAGKVKKLALYEPPFIVDDSHPPLPNDYVQQVNRMVAEGRRGDAVALFMKVVGVPEEFIPQMREMPMWPEMEKGAHTLAYDGTIMGDNQSGKPLPPNEWPAATMPTLVIVGGESPAFFQNGTQALVDALPNAQRHTLEGQTHEVAAEALAPLLVEFFRNN
jgi:uncharacterized protein YndB with AHSA1/START domain/pimeloyl-ACP methyl ester carboxylesterase